MIQYQNKNSFDKTNKILTKLYTFVALRFPKTVDILLRNEKGMPCKPATEPAAVNLGSACQSKTAT